MAELGGEHVAGNLRSSSPSRHRIGLGVLLGVIVSVTPLSGIGTARAASSASTYSSGCYLAISPTAGPVGTQVTVYGSTASCSTSGGSLMFQDEHAAVPIPPNPAEHLPAYGSFSYTFTIPASMPSGTPAAAAQQFNGGGPVAPGMADFAVFMGSPGGSVDFDVTSAPPGWADYVAITPTGSHCNGCYGTGYDLFRANGYLATLGGPNAPGNVGTIALAAPITGAAFTTDDAGYWMVGADGGVFAFGDAPYEGSLPGDGISVHDIVGIAATPDGGGYWLVGADGGVYAFGDAGFDGSMGGTYLNAPVVGIAATPDGAGYWLVASDGGVFAFGNATFDGSMVGEHLGAPVRGMAATSDGQGYWLVAQDGGVFTFGDARFFGSAAGGPQAFSMVGIAATPDGGGYWLLGQDGGVFTFGDAPFNGSGRNAALS